MTRGIVYEVDWFGCHVASKEAKVDNVGHCESEGYRTDEDDDALGSADGMPWVVEAQAEDGMSVFLVLYPILTLNKWVGDIGYL